MNNRNIVWHNGKVQADDRRKLMGQKGLVVWLTGLSGSGKSTIASELEKMLINSGHAAYVLDGDNLRHGINSDLGFSDEDRNENVRRIAEIAALFADSGMIALVASISPFRKMRDYARKCVGEASFIEVYVSTDYETCSLRDPKGLYKKNIPDFTGKDSGYEKPLQAEVVIDTVNATPKECAEQVLKAVITKSDW